MDLYGIHTGFHCSSGCLSVAFYQFIHFFGRQFSRNISSAGCRDTGSCCDRCSCIFCISFRACILQLNGNLCTFCMTGIYHLLKLSMVESSYRHGFLRPPLAPLCTTVASIVISRTHLLHVPCSKQQTVHSWFRRYWQSYAHRRNYKTVLTVTGRSESAETLQQIS